MKTTLRRNGLKMFDINVSFSIGLDDFAYSIYTQMSLMGREMPLLRKECIEYLKNDLREGGRRGDSWQDHLDKELYGKCKNLIASLFPELN